MSCWGVCKQVVVVVVVRLVRRVCFCFLVPFRCVAPFVFCSQLCGERLIHSHCYRLIWSECSWASCWWLPFFLCVQVVASAIVDKYIGESARVVREMFGYAKVRAGATGAAQKYGLRSGGTDSYTPLRQSQRVTLVTLQAVKATGGRAT